MNRQIICSLLSTFTGAAPTPAFANDNVVVAESHAEATASGAAVYYLGRGIVGSPRVRRLQPRKNFVPAAGRAARPLPVLRLLIARQR